MLEAVSGELFGSINDALSNHGGEDSLILEICDNYKSGGVIDTSCVLNEDGEEYFNVSYSSYPSVARFLRRIWSEDMISHLDGCGWQDGGCFLLAEAISMWSGGKYKIFMLVNESSRCDHAVVRVSRNLYFDSDGLFTEKDILSKHKEYEGVHVVLRRYHDGFELRDVPRDPVVSKEIAGSISKITSFEEFDKLIAQEARFKKRLLR